MVSPKRGRNVHAAVGITLLAAAVTWGGCGTDNGDPTKPDETTAPSSSSSSGSSGKATQDAAPPEPPQDATFEEDAGQPTPDPGDECIDKDDPGGTEATAKALPNIDDCDSSGAGFGGHGPITGVMKGIADTDFYTFVGSDTFGCNVDPLVISPTTGLEVCMFVACQKGDINFKGCAGGAQKMSDIGDPGCCVATPGQTQLDFSCGGITQFDDSASVFIRVKQTADLCVPYQLAYHF